MSYTNIELIRKHLRENVVAAGQVRDFRAAFVQETVQLPNAGLKPDSEIVKCIASLSPSKEIVTFTTDIVSLAPDNLVPESIVVASDSSLSIVYTENIDFVSSPGTGSIKRIAGGTILPGQTVTAWYVPYRIFAKNVDYTISYQNGTMVREGTGAIEPGQTVLVDYEVSSFDFSDEILDNAILEASALLSSKVDPSLESDGAAILTIGETYLALSILCRVRAMDVLASNLIPRTSASSISDHFLDIADRYRQDSDDLLRPYFSRHAQLAGPYRSRGES